MRLRMIHSPQSAASAATYGHQRSPSGGAGTPATGAPLAISWFAGRTGSSSAEALTTNDALPPRIVVTYRPAGSGGVDVVGASPENRRVSVRRVVSRAPGSARPIVISMTESMPVRVQLTA